MRVNGCVLYVLGVPSSFDYPQVPTVAVENPTDQEEVLSPDSPDHAFVHMPKAPSVQPPSPEPQPPQEPILDQHVEEEEEEEVHHEPLQVREQEPLRPGVLGGASFISAHQR